MVSSPNIRIIVVADQDEFSQKLSRDLEDQFPEQMNVDFVLVDEYDSLAHEGDNHVRFVFLGDAIAHPNVEASLPGFGSFNRLEDEQVSAVSLKVNTVDFYQKTQNLFSLDKRSVSLLPNLEDKNPALLGAIFAGTAELYECNMRKAMERLSLVGEVYGQRAKALLDNYVQTSNNVCELTINPNLIVGQNSIVDLAHQCSETYDQNCFTMFLKAQEIHENNECLQGKNPACSGRTGCGNIY